MFYGISSTRTCHIDRLGLRRTVDVNGEITVPVDDVMLQRKRRLQSTAQHKVSVLTDTGQLSLASLSGNVKGS